MQIEKHQLPDGAESLVKRVFEEDSRRALRRRLGKAYRQAMTKPTLREVKQVEFDPEDPCPCGSKRKAKNCCAGGLLRRLRQEKLDKEATDTEGTET